MQQPDLLSDYLQVQLYEDFAKSRAKASVEDSISTASTEEEEKPKLKATGHVFQVQIFFFLHINFSLASNVNLFYS